MTLERSLAPDVLLRVATLDDAAGFAAAQLRNRDHLAPWEPVRSEAWFTEAGQKERLQAQLERYKNGQVVPWLMISGDRVVGAMTLTDIVPGPFRSTSLGYWVDVELLGRGLATKGSRRSPSSLIPSCGYTGSRRAPWLRTSPPSACWRSAGSSRSAARRTTCT